MRFEFRVPCKAAAVTATHSHRSQTLLPKKKTWQKHSSLYQSLNIIAGAKIRTEAGLGVKLTPKLSCASVCIKQPAALYFSVDVQRRIY